MSGFEVAGIVLGSIPLVIAALEHCGQGLWTLQRWRKYQRELRSLTRNLETERVKLQNVCEKLLIGLVPPAMIESMIDDPMGDLWKDKETLRNIEIRLWKCFDVFERTIGDIKAAVDEMDKHIDSQRGGKVPELKRAIFTLSRWQYADLLSTIREGVSNLENLADRNIELEPARRVRSHGKLFILLQDISKSLYSALRSSLDCSAGHDVGLRLERRTVNFTPADNNDRVISDMVFKLSLSSGTSTGHPESATDHARIWAEIQVQPTKAAKKNPFLPEDPVFPASKKTYKGNKSVRFADSPQVSSFTPAVMKTETRSPTPNPYTLIPNLTMSTAAIGLPSFEATSCLCERVRESQRHAKFDSCGTITDHVSHAPRRYTVYPQPILDLSGTRCWPVISLRDVLENEDNTLHLPYRDRLQLAVVISSNILQLHGSPWLPDTIRSHDILFIRKHNYPIYDRPFVMKQLPNNDLTIGKDGECIPPLCNPTLLSLGILLIELILGKTFDSLRTPRDPVASSNLLVDYMVAQRLVGQVRMASSNYGTAVTRCIGGDLHKDSYCLDSEDFCQEVYSGVVALLERDLENS